ncbi:MAG: MAPEG family protein [Pseudomonadota bacterium]
MENPLFLTPMLALVVWTLVMWVWMYATRIPAMQKAGIDPQKAMHPGTYADKVPSEVRRVADNYNHLHEQPTLFYALMAYTALTGGGDQAATILAWVYVAIRIVHSIVQATINVVLLRFALFVFASIALVVLAAINIARVPELMAASGV